MSKALITVDEIKKLPVLEEDADEEILEIFIEESEEVFEEIKTHYIAWKKNPKDIEAIKVMRRGFHTLKGSGRMARATLIGEFAWALEGMLNKILDETLAINPNIMKIIEASILALRELIIQVKGGAAPKINFAQVMIYAVRLSGGAAK